MERYLDLKTEIGVYEDLFKECFKYEDRSSIPALVMVEEHSDIPYAFVSGYWQNSATFYIQYSGVLPAYQGRLLPKGLVRKFCKKLHADYGNNWFMAMAENNNIPAIKALLGTRFQIIGVRQTQPDKKLLVEFLRGPNGK